MGVNWSRLARAAVQNKRSTDIEKYLLAFERDI
jgi:hypothetical protein